MKNKKTLYWIITGIFAAFMLFTAIPDIMMEPDAVKMISGLGYPNYFIPFIGVAKVLGSVAILIPGFKSIKEWAYAGLFFDLFAATYSIIQTAGISASLIFMILPMVFLFVSYYLWHKSLEAKQNRLRNSAGTTTSGDTN